MDTLQMIVDRFARLFGRKAALQYARQAPLEISPDGTIDTYYGEGKQAIDILLQQYEDVMGKDVTDKHVRNAMRSLDDSYHDLIPERIRPISPSPEHTMLARIKGFILGSATS